MAALTLAGVEYELQPLSFAHLAIMRKLQHDKYRLSAMILIAGVKTPRLSRADCETLLHENQPVAVALIDRIVELTTA